MSEDYKLTDSQAALILECKAFCRLVAEHGIMATATLGQLSRLMNVFDGKPAAGKWVQDGNKT